MATTSSEALPSKDTHGDRMERTKASQTVSQPPASAGTTTSPGPRKLRALSSRQRQLPYLHTPTSRPKTRGTGKTTAPKTRQAAKGKAAKAATKGKKAAATSEEAAAAISKTPQSPHTPSCAGGKQDGVQSQQGTCLLITHS
ncbi:hypothetical protein MTO96_051445 [Rhipicephalus appendiculatus]